jgi:hypothetical protein
MEEQYKSPLDVASDVAAALTEIVPVLARHGMEIQVPLGGIYYNKRAGYGNVRISLSFNLGELYRSVPK